VKVVFITGTDTNVGKTLITGMLARFLLQKGYQTITQKWIQTGSTLDIDTHLKLMNVKKQKIKNYLPYISPYSFRFPASPHLAAKLGKNLVNVNKIIKSFRFLQKSFDSVIVEGMGGALVPFNDKSLVIDIAKKLSLPVIIVVDNKLGAINHTLLTIEAIKRRKMKIIGIIFNNCHKNVSKIILKDNIEIIKKLTGEEILGTLPYTKKRDFLYKNFLPIGRRYLKVLHTQP